MAIWQHDKRDESFDDGLKSKPGEEGFTREIAAKHFGDSDFSYTGTPDWEPPAEPADEAPAE